MERRAAAIDIRHEQIKHALKIKGILLADIASELGVSRALISGSLLGRYRSKRVEHAIAAHLRQTPEELWPDRYDHANGECSS